MNTQTDTGADFFIPLSCMDITYKQFIEFRAAEQEFFKANQPDEDDQGEDEGSEEDNSAGEPNYTDPEYINKIERSTFHMVNVCSMLCRGPIESIPIAIAGDNVAQLIESGFTFGFNDEVTLIRLYCHIVNLINGYKPHKPTKDYQYTWLGVEYFIDPNEAYDALTGQSHTVGEALTVLQLQKQAVAVIEQKGDKDGNVSFNLGLGELAVLLRPKGVKVPVSKKERTAFINRQKKIFEDLPLSVVLDVRFFLLHTLIRLAKKRLTDTFSTRPKTKRNLSRIKTARKLKGLKSKRKTLGRYSAGITTTNWR